MPRALRASLDALAAGEVDRAELLERHSLEADELETLIRRHERLSVAAARRRHRMQGAVTVRLPGALARRLRVQAARRGIATGAVVRQLLDEELPQD